MRKLRPAICLLRCLNIVKYIQSISFLTQVLEYFQKGAVMIDHSEDCRYLQSGQAGSDELQKLDCNAQSGPIIKELSMEVTSERRMRLLNVN